MIVLKVLLKDLIANIRGSLHNGHGKLLEFRIPRDRNGEFYQKALAHLRSQQAEADKLIGYFGRHYATRFGAYSATQFGGHCAISDK